MVRERLNWYLNKNDNFLQHNRVLAKRRERKNIKDLKNKKKNKNGEILSGFRVTEVKCSFFFLPFLEVSFFSSFLLSLSFSLWQKYINKWKWIYSLFSFPFPRYDVLLCLFVSWYSRFFFSLFLSLLPFLPFNFFSNSWVFALFSPFFLY